MSTSAAAPFRGGFEEGVQSTAPYFQAVSERFVSRNGLFEAQHGPRLGTAPTASIVDPYQSLQRRVQGIVVRDLAIGERAITTKGLNPSNQDRHARLRGAFECRAGPYDDAVAAVPWINQVDDWINGLDGTTYPQKTQMLSQWQNMTGAMQYVCGNDYGFVVDWGGGLNNAPASMVPFMQASIALAATVTSSTTSPPVSAATQGPLLVTYFDQLILMAQAVSLVQQNLNNAGINYCQGRIMMFSDSGTKSAWGGLLGLATGSAGNQALINQCVTWYNSWLSSQKGHNGVVGWGPNDNQIFQPETIECGGSGYRGVKRGQPWANAVKAMSAAIQSLWGQYGCGSTPNTPYACKLPDGTYQCTLDQATCAALQGQCKAGYTMCKGTCIPDGQSCDGGGGLNPIEIALIVAVPLVVIGAIGVFSYGRGAMTMTA